ncbi:hypothetical protein LRY60_03850 [Candidatus Woesebacteria bacterium]|nr:hypothetical protein [Candidatus Woesebacteria bacterium]
MGKDKETLYTPQDIKRLVAAYRTGNKLKIIGGFLQEVGFPYKGILLREEWQKLTGQPLLEPLRDFADELSTLPDECGALDLLEVAVSLQVMVEFAIHEKEKLQAVEQTKSISSFEIINLLQRSEKDLRQLAEKLKKISNDTLGWWKTEWVDQQRPSAQDLSDTRRVLNTIFF